MADADNAAAFNGEVFDFDVFNTAPDANIYADNTPAFAVDAFDLDAFDTQPEFWYGGIGHLLLELAEARRDENIETRAGRPRPRPIDRTTAPKFSPIVGR